MTSNSPDEEHEHFNGVCSKEFSRGYAFGRRDSYDEILRLENVAHMLDLPSDTVLIKVPRERYQLLQKEVEKNL